MMGEQSPSRPWRESRAASEEGGRHGGAMAEEIHLSSAPWEAGLRGFPLTFLYPPGSSVAMA